MFSYPHYQNYLCWVAVSQIFYSPLLMYLCWIPFPHYYCSFSYLQKENTPYIRLTYEENLGTQREETWSETKASACRLLSLSICFIKKCLFLSHCSGAYLSGLCKFWISQNHGIVKVGRDPQVHLVQVGTTITTPKLLSQGPHPDASWTLMELVALPPHWTVCSSA